MRRWTSSVWALLLISASCRSPPAGNPGTFAVIPSFCPGSAMGDLERASLVLVGAVMGVKNDGHRGDASAWRTAEAEIEVMEVLTSSLDQKNICVQYVLGPVDN